MAGNCNHCWHRSNAPYSGILFDGFMVQACCRCHAKRQIHRDHTWPVGRIVWPDRRRMSWAARGVVLALLLGLAGCNWSAEAEEAAKEHLGKLGFPYTAVSCVANDTDGDGYVSCTVADRQHKMTALECVAVPWTFNSGCRVPKVGFLNERAE